MKSPLSQMILAFCVCAAAIAGYWFWYSAVGEKSVAVAELESRIVTKTKAASRVASSRASLVQIAGDEETIKNYFVPEMGVVAFIDSLQAKGKEQGAIVAVLSVSSSDASVATPSLALSLTIDGTFDAVMRTIGAIEYAPYALTISGISLMQNAADSWRASMNIVVGSVSTAQSTTTTP